MANVGDPMAMGSHVDLDFCNQIFRKWGLWINDYL